jgi:hypothetical protein
MAPLEPLATVLAQPHLRARESRWMLDLALVHASDVVSVSKNQLDKTGQSVQRMANAVTPFVRTLRVTEQTHVRTIKHFTLPSSLVMERKPVLAAVKTWRTSEWPLQATTQFQMEHYVLPRPAFQMKMEHHVLPKSAEVVISTAHVTSRLDQLVQGKPLIS